MKQARVYWINSLLKGTLNTSTPLSTQTGQHCPSSHPWEADDGVSRTSGGGEGGSYTNLDVRDPPHIKLKLYRTSSGWSTSPGLSAPTTSKQAVEVNPSQLKPPQQAVCPQQEQASLLTPTGPYHQPVQQPAYHPLPSLAPQMMNPFIPTPPSPVYSNPMMCQNVAYYNPFMLPYPMMPQQQTPTPFPY